MSSEEKGDQEAPGVVAVKMEPQARTQGPPLVYRLQAADHDTRRAYNYSEATANMNRYRALVQQQPGIAESWFSLYELQKVRPSQPGFTVDVSRNSLGDLEETVSNVEQMLKGCGYEFVRRSNFADAVGLNPSRTAEDVGLMISLLIAENEWETSIAAYRNGNESFGKAKYLVVADPVHTPQTKSAPKGLKQLVDAVEQRDDENIWVKPTKVKKKLDFSDIDSDSDAPVKSRKSANPLVDTFMGMVKAGHMTMDELAKIATALSSKSEDVEMTEPKRTRMNLKPPTRQSTRTRRDKDEFDWEDELEMSTKDDNMWSYPNRPITVLQNLSIRPFDGAKLSPEEARAWLSKFLHVANLSDWNSKQRRVMFMDSLVSPAKHWVKQLPMEVKKDWDSLQLAFKRRYCTDLVPPRFQYYKLTQKSDELASNYLYRLNGAALRAGIDFRGNEDPEHLEDHIQQYFDTLHDKMLQMQFRFTAFDTIDELEKKVLQYESTQMRPAKKAPLKKSAEDAGGDVVPSVNRIDQGQRSGGGAGHGGGDGNQGAGGAGGGGRARPQGPGEYKAARPSNQNGSNTYGSSDQQQARPRCENCNKSGHTVENCWQLLHCEFCNEQGHPIKYCRAFIEKMAALHTQKKSGELTAAQVAEQLNH